MQKTELNHLLDNYMEFLYRVQEYKMIQLRISEFRDIFMYFSPADHNSLYPMLDIIDRGSRYMTEYI